MPVSKLLNKDELLTLHLPSSSQSHNYSHFNKAATPNPGFPRQHQRVACLLLYFRPSPGDLLGPTVRGVVDGVEELLRLPTGCGEQNLIYLGPNVYTTRYLKAVGRLTSTIEKKARAFIRQGGCMAFVR